MRIKTLFASRFVKEASSPTVGQASRLVREKMRACYAILSGVILLSTVAQNRGAPLLALWDTQSPLTDSPRSADRATWKVVPSDLLQLEANPAKASSDPGYYGRQYSFSGDAVVENHALTAVFYSASGKVVVFAKNNDAALATAPELGKKVVELVPTELKASPGKIKHLEILRHAGDEVVLEVAFAGTGSPDELRCVFAFGKNEIIEVTPGSSITGFTVRGPIAYSIAPDFIADDLILAGTDYPAASALWVPAQNMLLGLIDGQDLEFMMSWPKGGQQVRLELGKEQGTRRLIESVDFANGGQSFYLAALNAPGIWHQENLKPDFLEKDVAIKWTRPFPAKWKTQLYEGQVKTTFAFRESKQEIWRGVPGSYDYPVWFDGEAAYYHFSKKIPPKGESVIYFVEGRETPLSVLTPTDMLKATLGRPMSETIIDDAGRRLSTHHRRGGEGVRRACTCGCTEAIQAVFETKEEVAKRTYIEGALEDMIYFVQRHMARIEQYRRFAGDMLQFLQTRSARSPELKPFCNGLEPIVRQIPQEYEVQKQNMKTSSYAAYAEQLRQRTLALTAKQDPQNLKVYMELLKAWRDMGGAQDYVLAQCHTITRNLSQQAGYLGAAKPETTALAAEIRARCRQCLRNPDGYEIWADY